MIRGDVVLVDLTGAQGSEQGKTRVCVVIQNDVGNKYSPTTIIVPLTSQLKHLSMPTHALIRRSEGNGLMKDSMALCEQVRAVDKTRILKTYSNIGNDISVVFKAYVNNFSLERG